MAELLAGSHSYHTFILQIQQVSPAAISFSFYRAYLVSTCAHKNAEGRLFHPSAQFLPSYASTFGCDNPYSTVRITSSSNCCFCFSVAFSKPIKWAMPKKFPAR